MKRLTYMTERGAYCSWEHDTDIWRKLGCIEDIMEKYGIESIEDLETRLRDRDTWKRACELACNCIKELCPLPLWIAGAALRQPPEVKDVDYFYAEAQKEVNK